MRKVIGVLTACVIVASTGLGIVPKDSAVSNVEAVAADYNYGEALQKSMYFYQVQQSGPIAEWNQVSWRADCMMDDYITGGWFDAGDHIKFALTNAYSAAMLAWGMIEYPEGVEKAGLTELYRNNLKFALDFVADCVLDGEVVYQIGDIGFDHKWWGSAEVYMQKLEIMEGTTERPYFITKDSNVTGEMAAALAAGYLVFKDCDPQLAEYYLDHAKECFTIADTVRTHKNTEASNAMYPSSHFYDELFWAANWLYKATGEQRYLDLCESDYIPNLGLEDQSTELKYTWGHCWDDVQQGGTLLYAMNTGDETWINQFKKHLEYWTTGYGGKKVSYTPGGLAWLTNWGSIRHATTTAFLAYVASDHFFVDDSVYYKKYVDFADSQMNYAFGDNPLEMSYIIGMGDNYPLAWHHRTSSGVWDDQWTKLGVDKQHAHILYGAVCGGPNSSDGFIDDVASYENTEVADDYNAGYTAALCAMISKYGGSSDPNFPPVEKPKWDEFYIEACINQESGSYTEMKVLATNHSAWPARSIKNLSYNYYMDFTEIFEAGLTLDDVSVRIGYDEFSNGIISDPVHYDDNIYYVKISYEDGTKIIPTGQSEHQGEIQFRVSIPDNNPVWDSSNDYSIEGLVRQDVAVTKKITMYDGNKLIWGIEPDGTTPEDYEESELKGDINCDGKVDIKDMVMFKKYILGVESISQSGYNNADMNDDGKINSIDLVRFYRIISKA